MGRSCEGGNVPSPAYPLHWLVGVSLDRQRAPESRGESLGARLRFQQGKERPTQRSTERSLHSPPWDTPAGVH